MFLEQKQKPSSEAIQSPKDQTMLRSPVAATATECKTHVEELSKASIAAVISILCTTLLQDSRLKPYKADILKLLRPLTEDDPALEGKRT